MDKERAYEILKSLYQWGRANGSMRSEKNFNDWLETSEAKELINEFSE